MARLIVLGSGTAVPTPERAASGYLLEAGGERILFDSGAGTLDRLARQHVRADDLDRIFYTHFHLDHVNELPAILFSLKHPQLDRARSLPIHGPDGLLDVVEGLTRAHGPWIRPTNTEIAWRPFTPGWSGSFPFGEVTTVATGHTENSVAYRIVLPDGFVLVYSGDTGYTREIVAFAERADLLLLECALERASADDRHLDADVAARVAAEAGVRRLALTHFYPDVDIAAVPVRVARHFAGELLIVEDAMRIELAAD